MKKKYWFALTALGMTGVLPTLSYAAPVLAVNDFIIAIDTDPAASTSSYPGGEAPGNAFDSISGTKYLNFGKLQTGVIITPSVSNTTLQSMVLTTANDAAERDPASWVIEGSTEVFTIAQLQAVDNGNGNFGTWTMIAQGNVALPDTRETVGPVLSFANSTAYNSYRIRFPTVKNAATANSMQVADIGLFQTSDASDFSIATDLDPVAAFQFAQPDSRFVANERPAFVLDGTGLQPQIPSVSNYPALEGPANAIDGTNNKYLNFGEVNSGFIVTPASGSSQVRSFQLTTANDAEARDPSAWTLFGTNQPITSLDNSFGTAETWTQIDTGVLALPALRNTLGAVIPVNNATSYSSYKMLFTGVKDQAAANSMQIAEVSFFNTTDGSGADILNAGDPILAIDGVRTGLETKYLNLGENNSGLIVTPSAGPKVVTGLQITTADDNPARDPATYQIYGTNSPITSAENSQGTSETWTLIASGDLNLPAERFTEGAQISFPNAVSYASYKVIFPTVKDATVANSMQIGGLQLFDNSGGGNSADFDGDGDVDGVDFLTWQKGFGLINQTNNDNGDADNNGIVNAADLVLWKSQFGASAVAAAGAVPEPAVMVMTLFASAAIAGIRRTK